jgi:surface antigen
MCALSETKGMKLNMKKNLYFIMLLIFFKVSVVSAATNPYKQTGPYGTNCTWYAWQMAQEHGVTLPGWGNAKDWYNDAIKFGYEVGTTPKANSIVVWGNWTEYGHVGYVEKVDNNTLYVWDSTGPCIDEEDPEFIECIQNGVSEETDKLCYANAPKVACKYTIPPSSEMYTVTGYIYLDNLPKTNSVVDTSQDTTATKNETPQTVILSSNNNLSDIKLSYGSIDFNKDVLNYEIEISNEIDLIDIDASTEDEKATINGIGTYPLTVGLNEIKLTVTAEDSSVKEYIINITRKPNSIKDSTLEEPTVNEENDIKSNNKIIILISSFGLIIIFCLVLFVKKKIKK